MNIIPSMNNHVRIKQWFVTHHSAKRSIIRKKAETKLSVSSVVRPAECPSVFMYSSTVVPIWIWEDWQGAPIDHIQEQDSTRPGSRSCLQRTRKPKPKISISIRTLTQKKVKSRLKVNGYEFISAVHTVKLRKRSLFCHESIIFESSQRNTAFVIKSAVQIPSEL